MDFGGDTAYVFIAMIVLSDENGVIKHTVESLARVICKDVESVRSATQHLEMQDLKSNLKAHGGRRIVPLYEISKDETRGWIVVNKGHYRDRGSKEDRKDYMREYMRTLRNGNNNVSARKQPLAKLTHTDTDTDTDTENLKDAGASLTGFEIVWKTLPKRAGNNPKGKAESAYKARIAEKRTPVEMIDGAARYARYVRAMGKEGTEYVLQARTFLGPDKPFLQPWALPSAVDEWWKSDEATIAKGNDLKLPARPGESMHDYRSRIREAIAERAH